MFLLYVISAALVSIRHICNDLKDSVLCIVYVYSLSIFVPVHEVWSPDQLYLGLENQGLFQETSPCPESQYTELHYQIMDTHVPFSSPEGGVGGLGQISPPEGATAAYQPDGEGVGHQASIPMPKLGRWIPRSSHQLLVFDYSHSFISINTFSSQRRFFGLRFITKGRR